jgi:hypothetical protein
MGAEKFHKTDSRGKVELHDKAVAVFANIKHDDVAVNDIRLVENCAYVRRLIPIGSARNLALEKAARGQRLTLRPRLDQAAGGAGGDEHLARGGAAEVVAGIERAF